jgi:hypothetical protein
MFERLKVIHITSATFRASNLILGLSNGVFFSFQGDSLKWAFGVININIYENAGFNVVF